jgi:hypothetical protein
MRPRLKTLAVAMAAAAFAPAGCQRAIFLDQPIPGSGEDGGAGVPDGGPATNPDGAGGDKAIAPSCAGTRLRHDVINPQVFIAFDRSPTMTTRFGTGTRVTVAQQALRELIAKHQQMTYFGYVEFPGVNQACTRPDGCCSGVPLLPIPNNSSGIDRAMGGMCGAGGFCPMLTGRPTAQALAACAGYYGRNQAKERHILLITDGEPTCTADGSTSPPCDSAIEEIASLHQEGVYTWVLGMGEVAVSNPVGPNCVERMAQAGGSTRKALYRATDPRTLQDELSAIMEDLTSRSCRIEILEPVRDQNQISVRFDDVTVPRDPVDGWIFDPPTSTEKIVVRGLWCDKLRKSQVREIEISACTGTTGGNR